MIAALVFIGFMALVALLAWRFQNHPHAPIRNDRAPVEWLIDASILNYAGVE